MLTAATPRCSSTVNWWSLTDRFAACTCAAGPLPPPCCATKTKAFTITPRKYSSRWFRLPDGKRIYSTLCGPQARHLAPCAAYGAYQSTLNAAAGQFDAPEARSLTLFNLRFYSSTRSKNSLPTPQMGHTKSSGSSSTYSMWPQMVQRQATFGAAPAPLAAAAGAGASSPK